MRWHGLSPGDPGGHLTCRAAAGRGCAHCRSPCTTASPACRARPARWPPLFQQRALPARGGSDLLMESLQDLQPTSNSGHVRRMAMQAGTSSQMRRAASRPAMHNVLRPAMLGPHLAHSLPASYMSCRCLWLRCRQHTHGWYQSLAINDIWPLSRPQHRGGLTRPALRCCTP